MPFHAKRFPAAGCVVRGSVPSWRWPGATLVLAVGMRAVQPETCDPLRSAARPPNEHYVQPESTRRMIARIRAIYHQADPLRNPFRSTDQLPLLRAQERLGETRAEADPLRLADVKLKIAVHLLQSGETGEAFAQYLKLEQFIRERGLPRDVRLDGIIQTGKALCHLRAGERANCLLDHNGDSCIFPIQGGGVHQLKEGSTAAVAELTDLLDRNPGDLRARWLLNIAHMTLGEYPAAVPARWLIPPERFASEDDIGRFHDVAGPLGLAIDDLAGGVVMEDFDRDGFLDLMVSAWGFVEEKDQLRVFRNNGDGTFTERTAQAGLTGLVSGLNLIHGDYDNDGYADVLVLRGAWLRTEGHYPFSLLRNNGDFTFTDVTEEAGLLQFKPTQTAAWFDYNGDGGLDLFVGAESAGRETNACALYRNNGDGTFTECAAEHGVDLIGFVKSVSTGDYNNDGRPDLFLSGIGAPRILLRNDGPAGPDRAPRAPWKFTDVTEAAGIDGPNKSFPSWFWDYDNDGDLDLMVTGYGIQDVGDVAADYLGRPHPGQKAKLYRNNGDGTFTDFSRDAGVSRVLHAMGANFGDLDNDGWLDFYVGTGDPDFATLIPNRMFRNDGGRRFQDVTTSGGFGQLQKGHGIAFGDLDNDGDQDIYSAVGGAVQDDHYPNQLFANPGHGNAWLKLELVGVQTNRVALGARVKVVVTDEHGAERAIHRVVGTGATFGSNPLRQEIGLGRARAVERVEVFWPVTGVTQVFRSLEPNRLYCLVEGAPAPVQRPLVSFAMPHAPTEGGGHHHH
ncbi:MAG: CRTAC1 family protein [Verrucomicrobiota bacterium]